MPEYSYTDGGIPERELTLQYQPLTELGESDKTPSVAGGTEVTLFVDTIKEVFQKEPTTIPIQKGADTHFEGDKTLIVDTLKSKHKFEVSAFVYCNKNGKHSLDNSVLVNGGDEAQIGKTSNIPAETITANEFNKYIPLGETGIKHVSSELSEAETVKIAGTSTELKRGFNRGIVNVNSTNDIVSVAGDYTTVLSSGDNLSVTDNTTNNNGSYTVSSASYDSTVDQTNIAVNETFSDDTNEQGRLAANDYRLNYSKGEIKFFDTGTINTTQQTTEILGKTINTTTVISDDFEIEYTFDARAKNIARLVRRMSQLGNPFAMRIDKNDYSGLGEEKDSHDYLVVPKKVTINSQSEKPAQYKVELELRKGTLEQ